MPENAKKRFRLPHWLPFVLSLIGVAVLMLLYIWFVGQWFGNTVTPEEKFNAFAEYADSIKDDIIALSELEISSRAEGDSNTYFIMKNGDEQQLRDAVYEGSYMGESYVSAATGNRCARYYYSWYDLECIIIYDKGRSADHTDGSKYSAAVGADMTAAVRGNQTD
ncbi:MAG: hypothetical protein J6O50_14015 [Ruminiclostridium sp.]|nr:hypothetical protein [Ruminiclostridium sp.]